MPDSDILIELSDFYKVDIRELIDGERKKEATDRKTEDMLKKVADYTETEKRLLAKRIYRMSLGTLILFIAFLVLRFLGLVDSSELYHNLSEFVLGITTATLVLNVLYCGGLVGQA